MSPRSRRESARRSRARASQLDVVGRCRPNSPRPRSPSLRSRHYAPLARATATEPKERGRTVLIRGEIAAAHESDWRELVGASPFLEDRRKWLKGMGSNGSLWAIRGLFVLRSNRKRSARLDAKPRKSGRLTGSLAIVRSRVQAPLPLRMKPRRSGAFVIFRCGGLGPRLRRGASPPRASPRPRPAPRPGPLLCTTAGEFADTPLRRCRRRRVADDSRRCARRRFARARLLPLCTSTVRASTTPAVGHAGASRARLRRGAQRRENLPTRRCVGADAGVSATIPAAVHTPACRRRIPPLCTLRRVGDDSRRCAHAGDRGARLTPSCRGSPPGRRTSFGD